MGISVQQNVNLKALNTLGLDVTAEYFVPVSSPEELLEAICFAWDGRLGVWVLGGGSNLVLRQSIPGLCVHMTNNSLHFDNRKLEVGAGMQWHQLVMSSMQQGLSGLENLSLIPGQVGAAPIQNIGAYGVELAERVIEVRAMLLDSGESIVLNRSACGFGYRHSVFKTELKDRAVITSLVLELDSEFVPRLDYHGISQFIEEHHFSITAEAVSQAVCAIRREKLPDPKVIGNVGSFFKNPVLAAHSADVLLARNPNIPMHKQKNGGFKLSAAYLIEAAGLKGLRVGGAGVSEQHSLVIQNEGNATVEDVLSLAATVQQAINSRFDIKLDIEPRIFPN